MVAQQLPPALTGFLFALATSAVKRLSPRLMSPATASGLRPRTALVPTSGSSRAAMRPILRGPTICWRVTASQGDQLLLQGAWRTAR
jgi:hypothetical protein